MKSGRSYKNRLIEDDLPRCERKLDDLRKLPQTFENIQRYNIALSNYKKIKKRSRQPMPQIVDNTVALSRNVVLLD